MLSTPARAAAAFVAAGVSFTFAAPAVAQVAACGTGATALGPAVEIDRPLPGSNVSGTVLVEGRVAPSLFRPSRAELLVGGQVVDSAALEADAPSPRFSLRWNSASALGGSIPLSVVACGTGTGALARGQQSVSVNVVAPVTTTVAREAGSTSPTSVVAQPPVTAVAQLPTSPTTTVARRGTPAGAISDLSDRLPVLPDAAGPGGFPDLVDQLEPGSSSSPPLTEPLVLKDARDEAPDRRPPWLGLVVGASGVAGLVLSTVVRRRSERGGPRPRSHGGSGSGLGGRGRGSRGRGGRGRGGRSAGRYERRSDRVERDLAELSGRS